MKPLSMSMYVIVYCCFIDDEYHAGDLSHKTVTLGYSHRLPSHAVTIYHIPIYIYNIYICISGNWYDFLLCSFLFLTLTRGDRRLNVASSNSMAATSFTLMDSCYHLCNTFFFIWTLDLCRVSQNLHFHKYDGLMSGRNAWFQVIVVVTVPCALAGEKRCFIPFLRNYFEKAKIAPKFCVDDKTRTYVNQYVYPYIFSQFDYFNLKNNPGNAQTS